MYLVQQVKYKEKETMKRLEKGEVIGLYKIPNSMTAKEIYRFANFFTSLPTIKKYIREGIEEGEIKPEDIKALEEKEIAKQKEKQKDDKILRASVIKYVLTGSTRRDIIEKIYEEFHIKIYSKVIKRIIEDEISQNTLTKQQYDEIITLARRSKKMQTSQNIKEQKEQGIEL